MDILKEIVLALGPSVFAAIIAYIQWRDKQEFQRQLGALSVRLAIYRQALIDNGIPVPSDPDGQG